jgi:HEAT repeat protein
MTTDLDSQTDENLIGLALTIDYDEDEDSQDWQPISTLQKRGTRKVFDICCSLCKSDDARQRRVAIDILGQLGYPDQYPFREETLPILFQLMEHDQDVFVLESSCVALGHLDDPRAIGPLLKLKAHPHHRVRHGVVIGLLGFEDQSAVQALIDLSHDEDEAIRDWATFGLGTQIELDTPEVREALYERLFDEHDTTRGEAMVGLARRRDPRVLAPLLAVLDEQPNWSLPLEAAEELADSRLLPALLSFRAHWTDEETWIFSHLEAAIAICWGEPAVE